VSTSRNACYFSHPTQTVLLSPNTDTTEQPNTDTTEPNTDTTEPYTDTTEQPNTDTTEQPNTDTTEQTTLLQERPVKIAGNKRAGDRICNNLSTKFLAKTIPSYKNANTIP
jgi:hypothetical protein